MAVIYNKAEYTNIMTLPKSTGRSFGAPLDPTAVWKDWAALQSYATNDPTAYVGQVVTYVNETAGTTEAYLITNTSGALKKLAATTTTGDIVGDVANLQTQVGTPASGEPGSDGYIPATGIYKDVEDINNEIGEAKTDLQDATGLYALIEDAMNEAAEKVASVTAGDNSITVGGTATEPTVAVKVDPVAGNALSLSDAGLKVVIPAAAEYTIEKLSETTSGSAASYQMKKGDAYVGAKIEIPKDLVVKEGSVVTLTEEEATAAGIPGGAAGTYIKLVLQNDETHPLYINASSLIEYVTGGQTDEIVFSVDANTHVATATLRDGSIAKARLDSGVQASLDLADSALQKADIVTGTTNGTISVEGEEVAVAGLGTAAFEASTAFDAAGAAAGVKAELLGAETSPAAETIRAVKKTADDAAAAIAALDVSGDITAAINDLDVAIVESGAGEVLGSIKQEDGKIVATKKTLAEGDIPALPISHITDLGNALTGKVTKVYGATAGNIATLTADGAIADAGETISGIKSAATNAIAAAKTELLGEEGYSGTIKGAYEAAAAASGTAGAAMPKSGGVFTGDVYLNSEVADNKLVGKKYVDDAASAVLGTSGDEATANTVYGAKAAAAAAQSAAEGAQSAAEAADAKADTKIASVAATTDGGLTISTSAAKAVTAGIKLDPADGNLASLSANGLMVTAPAQTDYAVTVTPSDVTGIAKRYTIAQAATGLSAQIDIPADMVVSSGRVVENPAEQAPGTYLELTLANSTNDKIYINVGNLIEYVTSGSEVGDQIQIAISDDHKVTATLSAGSVTKAQLHSDLQAEVDKGQSALDAIAALDYADTAEDKKFVTAVNQENGVISVTRAAVADIALSGNVNDLVQTAGDVLVFNCGTSASL